MVSTKKRLLNFFEARARIDGLTRGRELYIFLDYDGTCTPIVSTPAQAVLSKDMRRVIKELSSYYRIAVVSGRATDDVRRKVRIKGIYYAGSHGFEIVDPLGKVTLNKDAHRIRGTIDQVHGRLEQRLKNVPGALIEHVKFTVSVHYRRVAAGNLPLVKSAVREVLKDFKNLRRTRGKKVFEIRPKIDWDKGRAVEFILAALKFDRRKAAAIYIGDDVTDEDAFRALRGKGFGILVAERERSTLARYRVRDPIEVKKVLQYFISRKKGNS